MSNNLTNPDANRPYYVATYNGQRAAIKRDEDYQATIKLVQKSIPSLRSASVKDMLIMTTLPDYGDGLILIGEEIWPEVVSIVKDVEVTLETPAPDASHAPLDSAGGGMAAAASSVAQDTRTQAVPRQASVPITIRTPSHKVLKFGNLRGSTKIKDVKSLIEAQYRIPADLQRLNLSGQGLDDMNTLEQSGVTRSKTLDLSLDTRHTMIYLFASLDQNRVLKDVQVKLSLDRAWELAALYPFEEDSHKQYIQSVSWTVDVGEDWKLFDSGSQKQLSCLTWDGM
ncbi:hypothetical protein FRC10_009233 [Ceratobasidium sp. 414]|nr:hypothetical protein FRC10_009233 [Ceratobasidium sp. 414]